MTSKVFRENYGMHFTNPSVGDVIPFTHPITGTEHKLTVQDFESCSHLVLSCLLWPVTAVLETAKTLALQRISDAPTGIDQFHIRKDQSSN